VDHSLASAPVVDVQAHHVAHVERYGADLRRGGRHRGRGDAADLMPIRITEWLGYRINHHQIAKAVVAKMAVRAIERSNESAANLIQSVTIHNFQSARLHCRFSLVVSRFSL
jgi:hypothetical protein